MQVRLQRYGGEVPVASEVRLVPESERPGCNCGTCSNSTREKLSLRCNVKRKIVHVFSICNLHSQTVL